MNRQKLIQQLKEYTPFNEQEEMDKSLILNWIEHNADAFYRKNKVAHVTASAQVVNKDRSKVLMVYHNIYQSWSWLGGHADGETDLLSVAIREVKEEALQRSTEPWFVEHVYKKLIEKLHLSSLLSARAKPEDSTCR